MRRLISGGMIARASALSTTTGVYTRANLVINDSRPDLRELAFSTSSRIRLTVESSKSFVVFTLRTPLPFTQPLITSSPSCTDLGTLSPVRAEVSSMELPDITTPSIGMRSPALMTITVPISTSSGSVSFCPSAVSTFAYSGQISIRSDMLLRLFPTA